MKGKNSVGDDSPITTLLGIALLNSTGDNLPESTGDDSSNSTGDTFILHWGTMRLFSAGGRQTLLGENITDSSTVASLSWGELSLLSFLTLRGVNAP